jgi:purine catabolism regulator
LSDAQIASVSRGALPAGSLSWSRGSEVVAIVPTDGVERARRPRRVPDAPVESAWHAALVEHGAGETVVAVGSVARRPSELPASHAAAQKAIRIALITGREVVRHEELVLERLLLANSGDVLQDFTESQIGALMAYDASNGSDLCGTLEVYLGVGNGAEAARRLYIHYNTMKHRLQRIGELAQADLHDPRTRLTLALALESRRLVRQPV